MNHKEELEQRLQQTEQYIELGEKLETIINEDDKTYLNKPIPALREYANLFKQKIQRINDYEDFKQKSKQDRDEFIKKYATVFGSEQNTAKYYDEPIKHPLTKAYWCFAKANLYKLTSLLIIPFSKQTSEWFEQSAKNCTKTMQNYFDIVKFRKQKKINDITLYNELHKKEMAEAKWAEELKKQGINEETIAQIIERPEIVYYAKIERLKEKYMPWL